MRRSSGGGLTMGARALAAGRRRIPLLRRAVWARLVSSRVSFSRNFSSKKNGGRKEEVTSEVLLLRGLRVLHVFPPKSRGGAAGEINSHGAGPSPVSQC